MIRGGAHLPGISPSFSPTVYDWLAREACRKWGGTVAVARADGGGELVTVRLPRADRANPR